MQLKKKKKKYRTSEDVDLFFLFALNRCSHWNRGHVKT